ncbi:hypothetical protein [Actinacidiphila oryziradicis]|uniref:Uncharacterized protein n=1 Tax=Actinacidiphila oryziradicis TaxID=2571141 RepID=A0A4U0SIA8_9ACTN|nr:hypothetical protein [Actinacidiphila oryziradicis]TKA09450.1 hypothetical protein FCI23_22990 [Actinacidiphila oryziradicis]
MPAAPLLLDLALLPEFRFTRLETTVVAAGHRIPAGSHAATVRTAGRRLRREGVPPYRDPTRRRRRPGAGPGLYERTLVHGMAIPSSTAPRSIAVRGQAVTVDLSGRVR